MNGNCDPPLSGSDESPGANFPSFIRENASFRSRCAGMPQLCGGAARAAPDYFQILRGATTNPVASSLSDAAAADPSPAGNPGQPGTAARLLRSVRCSWLNIAPRRCLIASMFGYLMPEVRCIPQVYLDLFCQE